MHRIFIAFSSRATPTAAGSLQILPGRPITLPQTSAGPSPLPSFLLSRTPDHNARSAGRPTAPPQTARPFVAGPSMSSSTIRPGARRRSPRRAPIPRA